MSKLIHSCIREQSKKHPHFCLNATLYEMNLRQFTNEGTFQAAIKHLPRLKTLGVKIIWLMPIFPIGEVRRKGTLGSYYAIKNYSQINSEFGTIEDFKEFLAYAHSIGLYVILDWVANHTSRDAIWTRSHIDWYEWDVEKNELATPFEWEDTAKLNYNNPHMRRCMINVMQHWLSLDVDGFRMDMAELVPMDFWEQAIKEMRNVKSDVYLLAEAQGCEFHKVGFDATYSWSLHNLFNDLVKGHVNADSVANLIQQESVEYPSNAIRLLFTSNHDENSWSGTEFDRLGDATHTLAALTFILNDQPLIYNGQECGFNRQLKFFDKDQIDWKENSYEQQLYTELIHLKLNYSVLNAGDSGANIERMDSSDNTILALKRKHKTNIVIALFNLTPNEKNITIYDKDFTGKFNQLLDPAIAVLHNDSSFYLKPWGFYIYYK